MEERGLEGTSGLCSDDEFTPSPTQPGNNSSLYGTKTGTSRLFSAEEMSCFCCFLLGNLCRNSGPQVRCGDIKDKGDEHRR